MADSQGVRGFADKHLGVLATIAFFVVAGMRILGASDFQTSTAVGLANAAGLAAVVFATAIALTALAPLLLFFAGLKGLALAARQDKRAFSWLTLLVTSLILAFYLLPPDAFLILTGAALFFTLSAVRLRNPSKAGWFRFAQGVLVLGSLAVIPSLRADDSNAVIPQRWLWVFLAAGLFVYAVQDFRGRPLPVPEPTSSIPRSPLLLFFVGAYVVISLLLTDEVWMPSEVLTVDGVDIVGYVVEDDGPWLTVLDEDERVLRQVHLDSVERRVICSLTDASQTSMSQMLSNTVPARPPLCSDL